MHPATSPSGPLEASPLQLMTTPKGARQKIGGAADDDRGQCAAERCASDTSCPSRGTEYGTQYSSEAAFAHSHREWTRREEDGVAAPNAKRRVQLSTSLLDELQELGNQLLAPSTVAAPCVP